MHSLRSFLCELERGANAPFTPVNCPFGMAEFWLPGLPTPQLKLLVLLFIVHETSQGCSDFKVYIAWPYQRSSWKMKCWRTHFVCLSDRTHSWKNFVHFTIKHDLKSQTFGYGRYGVIFGWVQKMLIYAVNRPESVINFQSVMEVHRLEQVSKIFAKSVWGRLRAVFGS